LRISPHASWLKTTEKMAGWSLVHLTEHDLSNFGIPEDLSGVLRQKLPLKCLYVVKLFARQKMVGVMVVGFYGLVHEVQLADKALLTRLGEAVGIAIDNKMLFEENRQIVSQLR